MKLVNLKCISCGANVDLGTDKKIAFCPYCGAKMLIDDEIQRIELSGKIEVSGIPTLDRLCTNAETFIGIGDYKNAERTIEDIYKNYPNDYRGYYLALLNKISSKPNHDHAISDNPKYNVYSFFTSIPMIFDVCNLANKALHFAPTEKQREIKDITTHWLSPLNNISEDARNKIQEYYRLESICEVQSNEIRKRMDDVNSDIIKFDKKRNQQLIIMVLSVVTVFLGFFLVPVHPVFILVLLAAMINMIVFLIKFFVSKSRIAIGRKRLNNISLEQRGVKPVHGHTEWPNDQGNPEFIKNALDAYFSSLSRFASN